MKTFHTLGRSLKTRALLLSLIVATAGCAGGRKRKAAEAMSMRDPDTVRYRLLLRENSVDSSEAFRCFGACQEAQTPDGYVKCLMECPGAEQDAGFKCAPDETPPVAACVTARRIPQDNELEPGWIVLSVVAGTAVVLSLASVCSASQNSQCTYPITPIGAQPSPQ